MRAVFGDMDTGVGSVMTSSGTGTGPGLGAERVGVPLGALTRKVSCSFLGWLLPTSDFWGAKVALLLAGAGLRVCL